MYYAYNYMHNLFSNNTKLSNNKWSIKNNRSKQVFTLNIIVDSDTFTTMSFPVVSIPI